MIIILIFQKNGTNLHGTKLKKETFNQLEKMFKGLCAYCEGFYGGVSYGEIEHFKPKSLYPRLMFDYSNMNIACRKCNENKKEKFDERLINPTDDNPEEHIKFRAYMAIPLDEKGKITINMFKLNDKSRTLAKERNFTAIKNGLDVIKQLIDNIISNNISFCIVKPFIVNTILETERMFTDDFEYCTMYRDNFQEDIENLKKIIEIIDKD